MSNAIWKTRNQLDFTSFVGKWFGFMQTERYFREEKNGIQGWTLFCVVDILFFFVLFDHETHWTDFTFTTHASRQRT